MSGSDLRLQITLITVIFNFMTFCVHLRLKIAFIFCVASLERESEKEWKASEEMKVVTHQYYVAAIMKTLIKKVSSLFFFNFHHHHLCL